MGLFEDVQAVKAVESNEIVKLKAELASFKLRFASLNKEYQSALDMVETLKSEQIAMEDCHRDELNTAIKEIRTLKSAFVVVVDELKHEQRSKAAIIANRNFWKRECQAVGMLYKLTDEELTELKSNQPKLIPLRMSFTDSEEAKVAANIVPAIGK